MNFNQFRDKTLNLKYVISIYRNEDNETYVDIARTSKNEILAFKPITESTLRKLLIKLLKLAGYRSIEKYEQSQTYDFPILHIGNSGKNVMFIEYPERIRSILFQGKEAKVHNLPPIAYFIKDGTHMYVYEILSGNMLTALNLPNISNDGRMCLGGKSITKAQSQDMNKMCRAFYKMFWENSFTTHSDSTQCNWDTGIYRYRKRKNVSVYELNKIV